MAVQVTTLPALKNALGVSQADSSEDAALLGLIAQCDQVVRTWLKVTSWAPSTSYTEQLDGNNSDTLVLRQKPVLTVTSVWESATRTFDATTLLTADTDYLLPADMPDGSSASWTGRLVKLRGVWLPGYRQIRGLLTPVLKNSRRTVKVAYTAGWASGVPADITLAAHNVIASFRAGANYGKSLSSFSYKGFSPQFAQAARGFFGEEIKDLLPAYRRLLR